MRSGLRLMPLFLRRGTRGNDLTALTLAAVGVAVATAVALVVLSLRPGLDARDDRMAWREPTPAAAGHDATAAQVRSSDLFDGDRIERIDLAPLDAGDRGNTDLPAPPGLPRFPDAGEIFVSPALARLMDDQPADRLAERFPGTIAGTIGSAGLAHADELVAVVGHGAGDLDPGRGTDRSTLEDRFPGDPSSVVAIAGFAQVGTDPHLEIYQATAALGAVLLTVPAVLLVGSAARLTAARRNQRLASLRLAGATPGAVVTLTAAETAVAAVVGSVAGIALYAAALPLVAPVPLAGGPWEVGDLWLGWSPILLALVVAPLLAAGCAAVALRQVVISPLGVAQRVRTRRPRAIRLVGMVVAWLFLAVAAQSASSANEIAPILIGVGAVIGSLALVGPWVTWVLGLIFAGLARRPAPLLAARRILDDPKAAYRSISGIVLAGLVAGFLFTITPSMDRLDDDASDSRTLEVWVHDPDPSLVTTAQGRLDSADMPATVELEGLANDLAVLTVTPKAGTDIERIRTALAGLVPDQPLVAGSDDVTGDETLLDDFRRASLLLSVAALVLAAATTAITSSASILDQRTTLTRLRLAGTSVTTLQRARTWQTAAPLVVATAGSLLSGFLMATVLLAAAGAPPEQMASPDVAGFAGVIGFGLLLTLAAGMATRPLLVAATATD